MLGQVPENNEIHRRAYVDIKTAQGAPLSRT